VLIIPTQILEVLPKKKKSVLTFKKKKPKESLTHDLVGVECSVHIIHKTIKIPTDVLPVDIEGIILKIYSYFYLHTTDLKIRKNSECTNQEYKKISGYSKARWLALHPTVEQLLNMFLPLNWFF
jgi:hypothetical protein